jgi:hypothetical protein
MNALRFAFISRHTPTPEQLALAKAECVELVPIGDHDAFEVGPSLLDGHPEGPFDGVVVVHPAAALRLCNDFLVGVFKNGTRPGPDQKPQFFAEELHIYDNVG